MKRWVWLFLIFIVAMGYRFVFFPANIYFGFDQARDAFISQQWVLGRELKLLGPPTDLPGIFHGPLYYYLIGPFYVLSRGSPELPFAVLLIINAAGVFLVYKIGKEAFGVRTGLLSALIYAVSFEQYQYSYYAADPSPGMISVLIFYWGCLEIFLKRRGWGLILVALGVATAVHFEFFLAYLFLIFLVYCLVYREEIGKVGKKWWFVGGFLLLGGLANYLLAEIKYDFRMTKALFTFADKTSEIVSSSQVLMMILDKYAQHVYLNIFGFSIFYGAIIFIFVLGIIVAKRNINNETKFMLLWVFSPLALYAVRVGTLDYFMTNIGVSAVVIILVSSLIHRYVKSRWAVMLMITVIILGNFRLLVSQGKNGLVWGLLAVQNGMLLTDEKRAVDYTYERASGSPFAIRTLGMPLKIQTTWAYLYQIYGREKYGYWPYYIGGNVAGFPGKFPETDRVVCKRYVIIEPLRGVAGYFVSDFVDSENKQTRLITEKKFGLITVQQRLPDACQGKDV